MALAFENYVKQIYKKTSTFYDDAYTLAIGSKKKLGLFETTSEKFLVYF